ncbi:monovalent cation/H+ antiporter complex subunit F [Insolitispirillum peregrinum]|uniref:Multisubunit sodium/proton antiporter, MrpF subunit n=1 Tax=Insolitispirillum peregrinum TaxID=80876 RepID=A0A1N7NHB8_9PROT|nr:monovalent cation/H+ antiporter complex subunit F [Insolitispirillum peregrinum]SIS97579.1 multisubunit sodium/proton antiporter, MrpF subunit [Insolitispirillum peregrinum]
MILYAVAAGAVLITMLMALARALLGPSLWDRILAINSFGTGTVLMIAILGYLTDRPEWEDIALVYALINFIGTIAVMKFIKFSNLGGPRSGNSLSDL